MDYSTLPRYTPTSDESSFDRSRDIDPADAAVLVVLGFFGLVIGGLLAGPLVAFAVYYVTAKIIARAALYFLAVGGTMMLITALRRCLARR